MAKRACGQANRYQLADSSDVLSLQHRDRTRTVTRRAIRRLCPARHRLTELLTCDQPLLARGPLPDEVLASQARLRTDETEEILVDVAARVRCAHNFLQGHADARSRVSNVDLNRERQVLKRIMNLASKDGKLARTAPPASE